MSAKTLDSFPAGRENVADCETLDFSGHLPLRPAGGAF